MAIDKDALNEQLKVLQRLYLAELPDTLNTIKDISASLEAKWDLEQARRLVKEVHLIAGAAGSFGLPELSELARETEQSLKPLLNSDNTDQLPIALQLKLARIYSYDVAIT